MASETVCKYCGCMLKNADGKRFNQGKKCRANPRKGNHVGKVQKTRAPLLGSLFGKR